MPIYQEILGEKLKYIFIHPCGSDIKRKQKLTLSINHTTFQNCERMTMRSKIKVKCHTEQVERAIEENNQDLRGMQYTIEDLFMNMIPLCVQGLDRTLLLRELLILIFCSLYSSCSSFLLVLIFFFSLDFGSSILLPSVWIASTRSCCDGYRDETPRIT